MLRLPLRPARARLGAVLVSSFLVVAPGCAEAPEAAAKNAGGRITVAAASSLAEVTQDLLTRWEAEGGARARLTLGATSTLARQLEQGAPFDVFLAADERWLEELTGAGWLEAESRVEVARGRLVVAVPTGGTVASVGAGDGELPAGRWTSGDPAHVPLGTYALEALEARGEWDAVSPRLIPAGSARAALRLLELGEVDWGILYRSDAAASSRVRVLFELGEDLHRPIRYCAAAAPGASEDARRWLGELAGAASAATFAAHGFDRPGREGDQ